MSAKAIIFDLGGVILNLQPDLTRDAFERLSGFRPGPREESLPLFHDFERGHIGEERFRQGLRDLLGVPVHDDELDAGWNAMLLDLPPDRLTLLANLAKTKRIFLLSNTNSIHKRAFDRILSEAGLAAKFASVFESMYFSHEIGMRKPDAEIYRFVLEQNRLRPEETIFVDDMQVNIEQACALGIRGMHLCEKTILDLKFD